MAWQRRQLQLLAKTYTKAWQQGANAYRTQQATPRQGQAARKPPPAKPQPQAMQRALGPAANSLVRMAAAMVTLTPAAGHLAVAKTTVEAVKLAIREYLRVNARLLAAGVSVAWAGEQAGYAQAADSDGMLLKWELGAAVHSCADCPALAGLPPMPLDQWPTMPGEGMTECSVGCKCSMVAVSAPVRPLNGAQHEVLSRIGNRQAVLAAA